MFVNANVRSVRSAQTTAINAFQLNVLGAANETHCGWLLKSNFDRASPNIIRSYFIDFIQRAPQQQHPPRSSVDIDGTISINGMWNWNRMAMLHTDIAQSSASTYHLKLKWCAQSNIICCTFVDRLGLFLRRAPSPRIRFTWTNFPRSADIFDRIPWVYWDHLCAIDSHSCGPRALFSYDFVGHFYGV